MWEANYSTVVMQSRERASRDRLQLPQCSVRNEPESQRVREWAGWSRTFIFYCSNLKSKIYYQAFYDRLHTRKDTRSPQYPVCYPVWRHWLESAKHPFQVLTDHTNLDHLKTAKRLNPRQARCALFITRFNFEVSYRPGSENTKADALSRIDHEEEKVQKEETVLPNTCYVNAIQWKFNREIQTTMPFHVPSDCPSNKQ